MRGTIPFFVESKNGHDTLNIPNNPQDIQNAVETQLQDKKWVTLVKEDGSSEILTAKDVEQAESEELGDIEIDTKQVQDDDEDEDETETVNTFGVDKGRSVPKTSTPKSTSWANKFQRVTSATATKKAGGG